MKLTEEQRIGNIVLNATREELTSRLEEKQAQIDEMAKIIKNHKTNIEALAIRVRKLEEKHGSKLHYKLNDLLKEETKP